MRILPQLYPEKTYEIEQAGVKTAVSKFKYALYHWADYMMTLKPGCTFRAAPHEINEIVKEALKSTDEMREILQAIVGQYPDWERDEEVSGADLVEFMGTLWPKIRAALAKAAP